MNMNLTANLPKGPGSAEGGNRHQVAADASTEGKEENGVS